MNSNLYRLVFDEEHGSWVPVAEHVRGRGKRHSRRRALAAAMLALLAGVAGAQTVPAPGALPVPSTLAGRPFVFSGSVAGGAPSVVGNAMTINTASRTLGLNWDSFNIGSNASVRFIQPDAASRVLNRIWSADPSVIMGRLDANGQVYLINQNGILFGNGAQVNVGGLVASALNLSPTMLDRLLNQGLPGNRGDSLSFAWDGDNAGFAAGFVTVDSGARIASADGGRVVLLAPRTVDNKGTIAGNGIETILGAGGKVVLTVPDDPSLRGLLVETDAFATRDALGNAVKLDGSVSQSGTIDAGNGGVVTLAALAVNQKGLVNATRAVNLNGTTMLVSGTTETNRLSIHQRGKKAEIDWVSGFSVDAGKTLEFIQPDSGSVVYNYVYDPDRTAADGSILNQAGRSAIDGVLRATGQFFLINERGVRFAAGADVQAANVVVSALGVNPALVASGLFAMDYVDKSGNGQRAFYLNKTQLSASSDAEFTAQAAAGQAAFDAARIDVEAGARIAANVDNGLVMLFGADVAQAGTVTADKGQVLLAAGADVYLKPPFAAGLRGFMAEVNPLYVVRRDAGNAWSVVDHGSITNRGAIAAALGNISLIGYDIAQLGSLWTSTSATLNGSIRLVARDQVALSGLASGDDEPPVQAGQRNLDADGVAPYASSDFYNPLNKAEQPDFIVGQYGGKLSFGVDSVTQVAIDGSSGKTVTAGQAFLASSIEAIARQIIVDGAGGRGALLQARGGHIDFMASDRFSLIRGFIGDPMDAPQLAATPDAGVGIHVEGGARLDVSGVVASKSVADLFMRVELRGDEFAGNPVQRTGALRGKTAYVDIRDKVAIADLSGYIAQLGQTVEEKAATGGSIALQSTGSVVVKQGSTLDVSGGGIDYAPAEVTESRVLSIGGQSYRLNDAPTTAIYYGLQNITRNEAAYYEGRSAGSVEVSGHSLAIDGRLLATTTRGARQREIGDPLTNHYATPLGGQLIVRDAGQHFVVSDRQTASEAERIAAYTQAQIAFVQGASRSADGLQAGDAAGPRLELSQSLVDDGFSRFDLRSDGRIEVAADVALNLQPGGSFKAAGRQVVVAGDIVTPGGSIELTTRDMSLAPGLFPTIADASFSTLLLTDGALLSTAGRWVNDRLDRNLASRHLLALDGGSVKLDSAYDIDLQAGSRIDVSGGAQLTSSSKLIAGDAGKITLSTGGIKAAGAFAATQDLDRRDASLFIDGTLAGQALGSGGSLEISTSQVSVGSGTVVAGRTLDRAARLASDQVGIALAADFFDRGGFFDFKLVGRDGVHIADGTRIAPKPLSWTLDGVSDYRLRASGSALGDFARSLVLHPDRRSAATSLAFATRSLNYGELTVGDGASLAVAPGGSITLESWGQLTVLGTLQASGGTIRLSRPANRVDEPYNRIPIEYSEARQAQSIYLGEQARLLAGGTTVLTADTRRALEAGNPASALRAAQRYKGEVLAGGTVDIDAGLGYLITREGSLIDVSGAVDSLNVAAGSGNGTLAYPLATVGSAGGTVSLAAREGMILDGDYAAAGRNGAPGGALAVHLYEMAGNATWDSLGLPASMQGARSLTLFQSLAGAPAAWTLSAADTARYLAGEHVLASGQYNGRGALDLASATAGGFGSWYLRSRDEIVFAGNIAGGVANQLQLSASTFRAADDAARVNLQAAAIQLGNAAPSGAPNATAAAGGAVARFAARDIGLIGNFSWNGFAATQLASSGEIHFDSTANSAPNRSGGRLFSGQMTAAGRLELAAARLSPSTYSDYRVDLASDPGGEIVISRPAGASAAESLAVGGRLEFAAPSITHAGTVTAPLGEVAFSAPGGRVELTADSVTSVAGGPVSLLGETDQSGRYWKYEAAYWDPQTGALRTATYNVERAPEKAIVVDAADSIVASGAKLDLSGGGDALALEFTPGPGGKKDILAAGDGAAPQVFAVLPDWQGAFAPVDSHALAWYNVSGGRQVGGSWRYSPIPSLKAGDQVYLAANGSGLAAGNYTLLPAAYAKLPGAYLVSISTPDDKAVAAARPQADGSWLVNGSLLARNADGSSSAYRQGTTTFSVAGQATVDARARYELTALSQFFFDSAGATLPGDAGRLSVVGRQLLTFDPAVTAMRLAEIAAADGRTRAGNGLQLDLAAPKLLVGDAALAPDASWSVIDGERLAALGVSSLLLGGVRHEDGGTTRIDTISQSLRIANDGATQPAAALVAPEIMLAASDQLAIDGGSRIEAAGEAGARSLALSGDGAFVRVAEGGQAELERSATQRLGGDLAIGQSAVLAGRSVLLDGTGALALGGELLPGQRAADGSRSGGSLAIGAARISVLGDGASGGSGLLLSAADLARFASVEQLRLASYATLDLIGAARLGSASLAELVISAAGIAGHGTAGETAQIAARSVVFANASPQGSAFGNAALGSGSLVVDAEQITFADNVADAAARASEQPGFAIRGFASVDLKAGGDVRFAGRGVTRIDNDVAAGGNGSDLALRVDAARVTTVGTADHLLVGGGGIDVAGGSSGGADTGFGGALELRARSLDVGGRIETPAGRLLLTATDGDVNVKAGAHLAAEGYRVAFADTAAYAAGGEIQLKAAQGDVSVADGALVSVAAAAGGGNAGELRLLAAQGKVAAGAGSLRGNAAQGATGARLTVDAGQLDLDQLAAAVATDGAGTAHFGGAWDIRARNGDLALSRTIRSAAVTVAADQGGIAVDAAGVIDASGAKGGRIALYGRDGDVVLGGRLLARGEQVIDDANNAGTRGRGGDVLLATSGNGRVQTLAGSLIDVSAADGSLAEGGKVIFRADRSASMATANDLNVRLAGSVRGARDVSAELVSHYTASALRSTTTAGATLGLASLNSQLAATYTANVINQLRGFFGFDSAVQHVRPGIEIASSGDFTISNDLNLGTLRYGDQAEAGTLTIRSDGDLLVNGTISDGFVANGSNSAVSRDAKLATGGDSWSYTLVAGADQGAARTSATRGDGSGNLQVAENELIRTGSGAIDLAAAGDIRLLDRAAVYTAGRAATVHPAGFAPITSGTSPSSIYSAFPVGGGDVSLRAGGDIAMFDAFGDPASERHINQWLFRAGGNIRNVQWWPRIASFQQGVAAFGGGDVTVEAGGNINHLQVALPTSGRVPTVDGARRPEDAIITGGGDLVVRAGGDVNGGLYYAETGRLDMAADSLSNKVALALGNTAASVRSEGDMSLGNVFNPLWVAATDYRSSTGARIGSGNEYTLRIGSYGAESSLTAVANQGDVLFSPVAEFFGVTDEEAHRVTPARVRLAALNGSIDGSLVQAPGEKGQLDLLAANSINLGSDSVKQLDLPASALPSLANPTSDSGFLLLGLSGGNASVAHAATPWHAGDGEASRLVARDGNITGQSGSSSLAVFNEPVKVAAGGDITDLSLSVQHLAADDVSSLSAGGKFAYTVNGTIFPSQGVVVNGPGRLEVMAGTGIDLGDSKGIVSKGNLANPYLPVGGADIVAIAGTTAPDYAGFLSHLAANGLSAGNDNSAQGLLGRFFELLVQFGEEAEAGGGQASYAKGAALAAALFPKVSPADIDLFYSSIKTEQGGGIKLLAPDGSINVGIANPSASIPQKKAADQGLFTFRGGAIEAFTQYNFLVNQSRVFTLDGGNIIVWADKGNIDAGTGAKTVSATPPPVLVVRDGQIVLDASNSVAGSGIGALASRDDTPPADMYLFAPQGAIDAGDAGLRSSGNIKLGAQVILNASNIQAGGAVSGAPASAPAAAPVAAISTTNNENRLLEEAPTAAGRRDEASGLLTVEVLECGETRDGKREECTGSAAPG